jgi:hypothetical protein
LTFAEKVCTELYRPDQRSHQTLRIRIEPIEQTDHQAVPETTQLTANSGLVLAIGEEGSIKAIPFGNIAAISQELAKVSESLRQALQSAMMHQAVGNTLANARQQAELDLVRKRIGNGAIKKP